MGCPEESGRLKACHRVWGQLISVHAWGQCLVGFFRCHGLTRAAGVGRKPGSASVQSPLSESESKCGECSKSNSGYCALHRYNGQDKRTTSLHLRPISPNQPHDPSPLPTLPSGGCGGPQHRQCWCKCSVELKSGILRWKYTSTFACESVTS